MTAALSQIANTLPKVFRKKMTKISQKGQRWTVCFLRWSPRADAGRFTECFQVLGKENVTGHCYWEVKWDGPAVYIALA